SEGKNLNWYGYKGHLAVATQSQYILGSLLSSGSMNDGKAAIPLLKGLRAQFPTYRFSYIAMDAGYDYEPIYEEVRKSNAYAITAYN
ncbi:transposase, partial [Paenibacillus sp. An7]|uniref:transposase n=1 Tax=Paenibacillus sp. An7 TaxID=2689577 RepID=UPI00135ADBD4